MNKKKFSVHVLRLNHNLVRALEVKTIHHGKKRNATKKFQNLFYLLFFGLDFVAIGENSS